jgi:hypothetical protein
VVSAGETRTGPSTAPGPGPGSESTRRDAAASTSQESTVELPRRMRAGSAVKRTMRGEDGPATTSTSASAAPARSPESVARM